MQRPRRIPPDPNRAPTLALPEPKKKNKPPAVRSLIEDLPRVFTPRSPVQEISFLQGRDELIEDIRGVLYHPGAAIVIHGERGVGKTSLAQLACDKLVREMPMLEGIKPIYYSVSEGDTYEHIMGSVLAQLGVDEFVVKVLTTTTDGSKSRLNAYVVEMEGRTRTETMTTTKRLVNPQPRPQVIVDRLKDFKALIIIDDYERAQDAETRKFFPELIKKISDNGLKVTLIIVGISETAETLVRVHPSVERNLAAIHVPRLTDEQIRMIAIRGFEALRLKYEPAAIDDIVKYSANFPYFTHRLCEGVVRAYINQARAGQRTDWTIRASDMPQAIRAAIRNSPPTVVKKYEAELSSTRTLHAMYVIAAAPFEPITRAQIQEYIKAWEGEDKDIDSALKRLVEHAIVERPETGHYRFCSPFQRAYTILRFRTDTPDHELAAIDRKLNRVTATLRAAGS